jgi:hypothetical protein
MAHAAFHHTRVARVSRCLALAGALLAATSIAHATDYDEVVQGDLSDDPAAPTDIGALTAGSNRISGTTIPSGTFDTTTHSYSMLDNDYVTFTVPVGDVLSQIDVGSDTIIEATDRLFLGIAQGSTVSVDPSFTSAAGLLGWTLVGAPLVGTDVLPALGTSAPPNFPAIGGATGFTGSLASGAYTLWILDGDSPAAYDFKLIVTPAVPEPSGWALMLAGMGLTGFALSRHARRR